MPIETDIWTQRTLGKIVERNPSIKTFFRDTFFKNRVPFNTESIDVDFKKGGRALAPFVHPKIGGKTVPNRGYQTKSYKPVLIAPNKITDADTLLKRAAGESYQDPKTPAERAVAKIAKDLSELDEMIVRREEWMAAQAIFTGQIPIIGEGLDEVIDFGFSNKEVILDAAKKWDADTAEPIDDLRRWHEQVQEKGFVNCNVCIMASDVVWKFINNKSTKDVLDKKAYDLAVIAPRQLPDGTTYVGTIHELGMDIYKYNEWYLDDWTDPSNPENKPLIPNGTVALLSTAAEYSIYYGLINYIPEGSIEWVSVVGDKVPTTWVERRPDRRFLALSSKPIPVPHEVDSWFVAQVM